MKDLIESLARFSKYNNNKPFKDIKRSNVIAFLESLCNTETQGSNAESDRYLQLFPNLFTAIFQVALLGHSILKIQKIGWGTETHVTIS